MLMSMIFFARSRGLDRMRIDDDIFELTDREFIGERHVVRPDRFPRALREEWDRLGRAAKADGGGP